MDRSPRRHLAPSNESGTSGCCSAQSGEVGPSLRKPPVALETPQPQEAGCWVFNGHMDATGRLARQMAWRLAGEEGIFAGTSSGMNVLGACVLARDLGPRHTVVTVAVDSGLKYLAGDLFGQEDP